jgi:hypothetical protein
MKRTNDMVIKLSKMSSAVHGSKTVPGPLEKLPGEVAWVEETLLSFAGTDLKDLMYELKIDFVTASLLMPRATSRALAQRIGLEPVPRDVRDLGSVSITSETHVGDDKSGVPCILVELEGGARILCGAYLSFLVRFVQVHYELVFFEVAGLKRAGVFIV